MLRLSDRSRFVFCLTLFAGFGLNSITNAGGRVGKKSSAKSATLATSIEQIQERLSQPARLKFPDEQRISLGDFIDQAAEAHQLSIRIDKNLASLLFLGRESMLVAGDGVPEIGNQAQAFAIHGGIVSTFHQAPVYAGPVGVQDTQALSTSSTYPVPAASAQPTYQPSSYSQLADPDAAPAPSSGIEVPASDRPEQPVPVQAYKAEQAPVQASTAADVVIDAQELEETDHRLQLSSRVVELLLETEISTAGLQHPHLSLESVLQHALDHVTTVIDMASLEGELAFPIVATHAYDLTLLVEDDHVLITTVAAANLKKTTKVYSVKNLGDFDEEELGKVIQRTVRPWSWRSQVNHLVEQVSAEWPTSVKVPNIKIDLSGVVSESEDNSSGTSTKSESTEVDLTGLKTMAQLLSSGTVAAAHTMISGTEMLHYADPPTADLETLPGVLIITQSQQAHREIQDLLDQLRSAHGIEESDGQASAR